MKNNRRGEREREGKTEREKGQTHINAYSSVALLFVELNVLHNIFDMYNVVTS